jgi:hypothetical protein
MSARRLWKVRDMRGQLIGDAIHTGGVRAIIRRVYKAGSPSALFTADTESQSPAESVIWPPSESAYWYENGVKVPNKARAALHESVTGKPPSYTVK